jgi:sarcosine oxidase
MDDAGYAVRIGNTDQYAIGVGRHKAGPDVSNIKDPQEWSRISWEVLKGRLQTYWPGLRPDHVGELRCRFPTGEWMVGGSEGFAAWQEGPVIAFLGGNLFKFAPLLGDLLAQAVVEHQIPAALRPRAS